MGVFRRLIGVAACVTAVLSVAACESDGPSSPLPSECTIGVSYSGPPAGTPSGSSDPMCPHHYAPVNLNLSTDWGASIRLKPADDNGHYGGELRDVPTGGDHWLVLFDIQWCGVDPPASPIARSGVSLNGVALSRLTTTFQGAPALAFSVDRSCVVRP